jgi:putative Mg2+ transporter-C (MgtC) family protein
VGHLMDAIQPFVVPIGRLMLAAFLGSLLGLEREWHNRTAGLRTNTLIALGSAVFTLIAIDWSAHSGGPVDTRIPAQIVTGVGFLGGGAILRVGGGIRGLTTAAAIWVNAGVGMAAGAGFFVLAISGTATALLVLIALKGIERKLDQYRPPEASEGVELLIPQEPPSSQGPRNQQRLQSQQSEQRQPIQQSQQGRPGQQGPRDP